MLLEPTTAGDIIGEKHAAVIATTPDTRIRDAAKVLWENRIGVLVVNDEAGKAVGILSERDIVRAVGSDDEIPVRDLTVADLMTKSIVSCGPEEDPIHVLDTMEERGFRHMPVMQNGRVIGVLSHTDILDYLKSHAESDQEEFLWSQFVAKL